MRSFSTFEVREKDTGTESLTVASIRVAAADEVQYIDPGWEICCTPEGAVKTRTIVGQDEDELGVAFLKWRFVFHDMSETRMEYLQSIGAHMRKGVVVEGSTHKGWDEQGGSSVCMIS